MVIDKHVLGLVAAFILGYLVLGQIFRAQVDALIFYVGRVLWPTRCWKCRKWSQRRNTRFEFHVVAGAVRVCHECHESLHSYRGAGN